VTHKRKVRYVTSSRFKKEEIEILSAYGTLADGAKIADVFEWDIRELEVKETLEVDLAKMVTEEVLDAYDRIKVPCMVEHAGILFVDHLDSGYPGGLTKAMWNALGDKFIEETRAAGRPVVARAVVGYCDGKCAQTFVGERRGTLADARRGGRQFYWDTVFIPDGADASLAGRTYAEIVDLKDWGLRYKVLELSQSTIAIRRCLQHIRENADKDGFWLE